MGRPLPPLEEPAQQQQAGGSAASTRLVGELQPRPGLHSGLGDRSAAADAHLHSLSNLVAFTRSVSATSEWLLPTRPPLAAPSALLSTRGPSAARSSSPPPLLADESDSGSEWDSALPRVLDASPLASQPPGLDDICPWSLINDEDNEDDDDALWPDMLLRLRRSGGPRQFAMPGVRLGGSMAGSGSSTTTRDARGGGAGDSLLAPALRLHFARALPAGRHATRAPSAPAAPTSSAQPLEVELSVMARRLAELARQHQSSAHPGMLGGLRDAANLLHGLANGVEMPQPA